MTAMRKKGFLIGITVLLLTGALAGCFGKDDPAETPGADTGDGGGETPPADDGSDGNSTTPDDGTGGAGGNETEEPPAEPEKPAPVNETFTIDVSGGLSQAGAASGSSTLSVLNGEWAAFDVACAVRGTGPNGEYLSDGGTFSVAFADAEVAATEIPGTPGPAEISLSVPSGEAGDYVFTASAHQGTSGWKIECTATITY